MLFLLLLSLLPISLQPTTSGGTSDDFLDVTQYGYEQYQDIIINNRIVKEASGNRRDCLGRYVLIQQVLNKYERPFSMLDIGASQGYYSFKTAYDYKNSVCVMIEGNNNPGYPLAGSQLLSLCKANNTLDNIIFLNILVKKDDLEILAAREHFDIVLAMNIIHRLENWRESAKAILSLGDNIIIETPPPEGKGEGLQRKKEIEDFLASNGGIILGEVPRHTSKTAMAKVYLISKEKKLIKKISAAEHQTDTSLPGINLATFKIFNGIYPTSEQIEEKMKELRNMNPLSWTTDNMILQGNNISIRHTTKLHKKNN